MVQKFVSYLSLSVVSLVLTVHLSSCTSDVSASTVNDLVQRFVPQPVAVQEAPQSSYLPEPPPQPSQAPAQFQPQKQEEVAAVQEVEQQESWKYVTTDLALNFSSKSAFIVKIPSQADFEEVRPLESSKPFIRTEHNGYRYAYSAFVADTGEKPENTIANVIKTIGFEQIVDEGFCTSETLPNATCYEYRAYNKSKQRVYHGRVYVVGLPSGVSTGHSLIISTKASSPNTRIDSDSFLTSFYQQSKELLFHCGSVEEIVSDEQKESDAVVSFGNIATRVRAIETADPEFKERLNGVSDAYLELKLFLLQQSNQNKTGVLQNLEEKATAFDHYCYGS